MSNNDENTKAVIKQKSNFSVIWILPFIAALIGMGMVYHHIQNQGIEITIVFEDAQGLEANKTKVKYRNVDIGTVKTINFNEDGTSIEALVEIDRKTQQFLHSDSQFWVVRPRIGSSGISGFGTLLSGAYIAIEPGKSAYYSERFIGLEVPPISSPTSAGLKLTLVSEGGKSLQEGNPIIYRGFEVGAVETVDFDVASRQVTYGVFIRAPFDNLITTNTHFWNAGGFSVSADTQGLTVDFASMETILSGGVQFDVPEDLELGKRVDAPREFKLYSSKTGITEDRVYEYLEYAILVEDSVGGLDIGAPVEYRGILLGRVHRPYLNFHQKNLIDPDETRIAVIVHIEPQRLTQNAGYGLEWFDKQMTEWIKTGMGARLETANYLTGSLKVSLDIDLDLVQEQDYELEYFGKYKVIPTSQSGFASIMNKTEQLLIKLEQLPLEDIARSTTRAIDSANTTILSANSKILATQSVLDAVESTLLEAKQTMGGLQPDSSVYRKLEDNLSELERTLNMMQPFLQEIRRKPNSLIFSDPPPADTEPKGKSQ
ncbi:intermembrane transport protein PqiB [Glaciecola petra]|uniref:Intermembrane transport protein PqiB n=1 Tax=Glaciecola petra TaxID=3075602 RepID=A0ABU2ZQL4_9ALTE|nr:intermembrane transport protein PqiB [Aestuariibacter sp. P117]MDT0594917.1 intermembrane transport protein PqiB [Aestuariibacter sp. P117]